jgi:hypothetical protein
LEVDAEALAREFVTGNEIPRIVAHRCIRKTHGQRNIGLPHSCSWKSLFTADMANLDQEVHDDAEIDGLGYEVRKRRDISMCR